MLLEPTSSRFKIDRFSTGTKSGFLLLAALPCGEVLGIHVVVGIRSIAKARRQERLRHLEIEREGLFAGD